MTAKKFKYFQGFPGLVRALLIMLIIRSKNLSYLCNFSSSVLHIPHNSFPYQKIWLKVQVNVVTPRELNTVCGESNEINGEKNCFRFYR